MSLSTLKNQINSEWNFVRAWIATHQTISIGIAVVAAWLFGHARWPF